ncbi:MAG: hypothetical protein U0M06_08075, partial [Clostridia bacterium]|nr:hypothetical protein [Clostridia bacterium]
IRTASGLYASEFAVFLCSSRRDTEEIADLCLARIDSMKLFLNLNSDKLSIAESSRRSAENAKVAIFGNFVVMAVSENAEMSINAARDLIS